MGNPVIQDISTVLTILVVDDNTSNRALAQATLEDEGYAVVLAADGAEGLALFEAQVPDCVLLDVRMPGLDGFEVCARLRALPGGADVPVVFLTAQRDIDTFEHALHVGGDDFLTKPVRPTELVMRVQVALELRCIRSERRELYALLRQQRDDLMRAVLHRERLTAFLVHDLKNPVAGTQLAAELILRDATTSSRSRMAAEHIRDNASELQKMILNLLDISRSDEGLLQLTRAPVDLPRLVGEVQDTLASRADAAEVTLAAEVDVKTVMADAGLLHRVLGNLVENAIRHAPPHSAVQVRTMSASDHVELRIIDAGEGVPLPLRERIFDRFVQAGSDPVAQRAGRGLGLAFCKMVIEAHSGRIWIEDAAPGAVFCISLPAVV